MCSYNCIAHLILEKCSATPNKALKQLCTAKYVDSNIMAICATL